MGVVDGYALDSSLVQFLADVVVTPVKAVVAPARVVVVGVGRMTHLDRIKNVEVFVSPTEEVFESHKAMGIGNEISSQTVPCGKRKHIRVRIHIRARIHTWHNLKRLWCGCHRLRRWAL
ncbi:hypothetical protein J1N35_014367 [Gossypium stocksii]|uniref:Uncharacterized protein n=1 Tax=Gossypium stocksii TaxID=47602 RepID=A0A9D4A9N4_9ROSI|nr:hypothetical protein J1N35_014367 [Gossypium stocksii]